MHNADIFLLTILAITGGCALYMLCAALWDRAQPVKQLWRWLARRNRRRVERAIGRMR